MTKFLAQQTIDHIKELSEQRGWTYYKLAKEAGIPHSSLSTMLRKAHMPSMNNIVKICDGLGVTLSEFFEGVEFRIGLVPKKEDNQYVQLWNLLDGTSREKVLIYMYGLARKNVPETITGEVQ